MKKTNASDLLKIAGIELLAFALFLLFLRVESVWIIVFAIAVVAVVFIARRRYPEASAAVSALFSRHKKAAYLMLVVLLILYPLISPLVFKYSTYWLLIFVQMGIYLLLALGLNLQLGSSGVINLAAAAFYGIGAYTAGLLALNLNMPALITIPAAGIVAAIFGAALYFPIYRTKGHYIALVSLAFQFIIVLALDNLAFTGGPQGLKSIPSISIFGYDFLSTPGGLHFYTNYYYFTLLIVVLTVIFFHRLHNSWVGLTLSYIRDDEIAARCFGVNSSAWQLIAFMTGTFFMGIGGSIYAHMVGFISPPNFLFIESLAILAIVIIGGMDNIVGVIIGTAILVIVPEKLRVITEYRILLYGLILIIMLLFRPEGLLPMKAREYHDLLVTRLKRKTAEKSGVQG